MMTIISRPIVKNLNFGFSLLEMAVVILIIGLLLGGLIQPLSSQRDKARIVETEAQLDEIRTALLGFAAINGRLPCPTLDGFNGMEAVQLAANVTITNCQDAGGFEFSHGFIPGNTLGLSGTYNPQGFLLDAWGSPIRYSITQNDFDGDNQWDFIWTGEMQDVGMGSLNPDLVICNDSSGLPNACEPGEGLLNGVPAVIFSPGKDWATTLGADQIENGEIAVNGFLTTSDVVFVSRTRTLPATGVEEFDDIVTWISPQILYSHMMQARQLP